MAKKELDNKKTTAQILYMNGDTQQMIAERLGVSRASVIRWCKDGGWAENRAAKNITRPELVNKLLLSINELIDKAMEDGNPEAFSGMGDKLSKMAATIEKLDKRTSVIDTIEVFIAFGKWMEYRMSHDKEITPELLKTFNKYQDMYINEQLSSKR